MKIKRLTTILSTWLFSLYLFLSPLDMLLNVFGTGTILRYIGILMIGILGIDYLLNRTKTKKNIVVFFTLIYCSFYLIASMWAKYITIVPYSIINLGLFYILLILKPYSGRNYKTIIKASILGGLIFSIYMIYNSSSMLYMYRVTIGIQGSFIDPNDMGANLIMPFFLCIEYMKDKRKNLIRKIFGTVTLLIISYSIFLTGSRGALIALVVGIFTYLLSYPNKSLFKKIVYIITISLLCFIFYLAIQDYVPEMIKGRMTLNKLIEDRGSGRLIIWENAIRTFRSSSFFRILFGYGYSNFPFLHSQYYGIYVGTHNLFIQNLLEGGLLGFNLLIAILIINIKTVITRGNRVILSILIATVVMSCTLETIHKKFLWNTLILASLQITNGYSKNRKHKGL